MALFDHRVFRHDGKWWVAQVHSGSDAGIGATDTVYFTPVTEPGEMTTSCPIPAGELNRYTHAVLVRLLKAATPLGSRLDAAPFNHPHVEADASSLVYDYPVDGTQWIARPTRSVVAGPDGQPRVLESIDLTCLDDSALRGVVQVDGPMDAHEMIQQLGTSLLAALIPTVLETRYNDVFPSSLVEESG